VPCFFHLRLDPLEPSGEGVLVRETIRTSAGNN
jgi:hypothetical protein